MSIDKTTLIIRAKQMLADVTPLCGDCGRLCAHACCFADGNTGMQLLPGEYSAASMPFGRIENEIFICNGTCDRKNRPYACMVFPLFPAVKRINNTIKVEAIYDIRSQNICPLPPQMIRRDFYTFVRRSGMLLCEDSVLCDFLLNKTDELEDIIKLNKLLFNI